MRSFIFSYTWLPDLWWKLLSSSLWNSMVWIFSLWVYQFQPDALRMDEGFCLRLLSWAYWWAVKCNHEGYWLLFLWYNPVDFKLSSRDKTQWAVILRGTGEPLLCVKKLYKMYALLCLSVETDLIFTYASARLLLCSEVLSMCSQVVTAVLTFLDAAKSMSLMSK